MATWAIAFAPSFATAMVHDRNLFGGSLISWGVAALVGAVLGGIVLFAAHIVIPSSLYMRRYSVWLVLAVFALCGVARGLGVGLTALNLQLVTDPQVMVRTISGAIIAVFWLSVATLIVDATRRHRAARSDIERQVQEAESAQLLAQQQLQELRERTQHDVVERVEELVVEIEALALQERDPSQLRSRASEISKRIDELSTESVRPLSHDVVAVQDIDVVRREQPAGNAGLAFRTVFVEAFTYRPFRAYWVALLLLPMSVMTAIRAYGPVIGILGAAAISLLAAIPLAVGDRVIGDRLRRIPLVIRIVVVFTVWMIAAFASSLPPLAGVLWNIGPDYAWRVYGIPLLFYVPITAIGTAIAAAVNHEWDVSERELASTIPQIEWATHCTQQQAWAERQRLSRMLHGTVQSALTASALRIEMAAAADEAELRGVLVHEVRTLTKATSAVASDAETLTYSTEQLVEVLERLAAVWERVADIAYRLEPPALARLAANADAAEHTLEIVRECVANSVRHGRARHIQVELDQDSPRTCAVSVIDDGRFTSGESAGLGQTLFESFTLDWSRTATAQGGTQVYCRVPIAPSLLD